MNYGQDLRLGVLTGYGSTSSSGGAILGASAGQYAQQLQQSASLEEYLGTLMIGLQRLSSSRARLERISDRLRTTPENSYATPATPPPSDLMSRYADGVQDLQRQCDEIERFINRIENTLFLPECAPAQCEKGR